MQLAGIGVVARLHSCRKVSGRGVGTRGAGKTTPACLGVRMPLPVSRGFLEFGPHPRCHNLNHQPSIQETLRLNGYIRGARQAEQCNHRRTPAVPLFHCCKRIRGCAAWLCKLGAIRQSRTQLEKLRRFRNAFSDLTRGRGCFSAPLHPYPLAAGSHPWAAWSFLHSQNLPLQRYG